MMSFPKASFFSAFIFFAFTCKLLLAEVKEV